MVGASWYCKVVWEGSSDWLVWRALRTPKSTLPLSLPSPVTSQMAREPAYVYPLGLTVDYLAPTYPVIAPPHRLPYSCLDLVAICSLTPIFMSGDTLSLVIHLIADAVHAQWSCYPVFVLCLDSLRPLGKSHNYATAHSLMGSDMCLYAGL